MLFFFLAARALPTRAAFRLFMQVAQFPPINFGYFVYCHFPEIMVSYNQAKGRRKDNDD
jgi:hypothetical protein